MVKSLAGSRRRRRRGGKARGGGIVIDGKKKCEYRAGAQLRIDFDPAKVQLDEIANERKPETGATAPRLPSLFCLIELLEDLPLMLLGDSDSAVSDLDLQ